MITKINADLDLLVLFKNGHNISNPIWVLFLMIEATFIEFMNFGLDCLHDVRAKPSLLLLD